MKISVVVANHGRDLTLLKNSVPLTCNGEEVELIIIDLGMERSAQRNIGIQRATGDIVIWLDSDQSISALLCREIEERMRQGAVALYIPEVIVADSFFGKIRRFEREFYTGTAVDVPRAVLRTHCPLFREDLHGPEDSDWARRIPAGRREITTLPLYHHDDVDFFEYFKKKNYYAKSMRRYKELNPDDKVLNWRYRCIGIFIENGKWKKILRHPILFSGVMMIVFIRAIIYLKNK